MTGVFARSARPALLAASRSDLLRRTAQRIPVTRKVVHRFVPGETCAEALDIAARLRAGGRYVSLDYLGEDVADLVDTAAIVAAYGHLLDALARRADAAPGGVPPLEVSVKLSALGQALDRDGEKIALENAHTICERAAQAGIGVTIDAEDHTTTDSRLSIVAQLRADFPSLGTVVQAYLKRSTGDCQQLAAAGARIRLCKGAYDEPGAVAFRDGDTITDAYLRCLRILMGGSGYPMVASHDPAVLAAVPALAARSGRGAGGFEYQMLYGIRGAEQQRLVDAGQQVRVYLPFGTHWYGYFLRRLAERPANLAFFLRALAERAR
ncbi:proline dehydrogenase family protein [Mycobacterium talmoniae]|uniref:proline dehydrogenase n=1 Tax=Mycobacterium talmoniae TaxID=1858794 RepID=A0A1S1N1S3_9MYCO|nr:MULTISPECIES: proline dehydrogenase family protein [Mycobacterium]OHU93333.1 proline dehydrogenase [Mycobacterium talmoniae]PQM48653.1 Proline dehydrogenase 1 [Mycobacterium talmoniae]TDH52469.1 proline dehydrogenase [Mycobacterium eburneum]